MGPPTRLRPLVRLSSKPVFFFLTRHLVKMICRLSSEIILNSLRHLDDVSIKLFVKNTPVGGVYVGEGGVWGVCSVSAKCL